MSGRPNESTLSSRRHEVLRPSLTHAFLRARGGEAAEPRQQPPVCSCGLLGGPLDRLCPRWYRIGIAAHAIVYTCDVKRRDLERRLADCGWRFLRSGGRHDVWTDGEREEAVPRHREISESLAKAILRRASGERK